ncbi:MAG: redoxin domain-containing protein [Deltaproteobacteria bacterium]|nr:redoxin domain-containing protein [Deltaproteobacteria bacterium]
MQKNFQRFEKHGVQVLVVSFSKRELFEPFAKDHAHSHFTFLRDPECKAYKAFGLRRAKITEMLKPTVAIKYFSLILKGGKVKKTQEDVYQLGGDFILDPQGKVIFSYPSQHPDDRPSIQELLSVLDQ